MKRLKFLLFALLFCLALVGCQSNETTTIEETIQDTLEVTTEEVTTAIPTYTVTKVLGLGMADEVISGKVGGDVVTLLDLTKEGYTFIGWYESDDFSGAMITEVTVGTSDATVYAKWEINTYTLSFNTNGGSSVNPAQYNYGETIVQPADPTREGYTFVGWYDNLDLLNEYLFGTMPAENTTLHAKWSINAYTVNFVDFDDSVLETDVVDHGMDAVAPLDPTRVGYTFTGWDIAYDNVTSDLTVRATYTINTYTVVFKDFDDSVISTLTVDHGDSLTVPVDPERVGYTFDGWDAALEDPVTGDAEYVATYSIIQFTISFDTDEGEPIEPMTVDYGETIIFPTPEKLDHIFLNWMLFESAVTGDVQAYEDMEFVANWESILVDYNYTLISGNITLSSYNGSDSVIVIPDSFMGDPIVGIGASLFVGNQTLTSITISENVTDIYGSAFSGCSNLTDVIFESNSQLRNIYSSAFAGCSSLENINLEDCTQLVQFFNNVFLDDTSLEQIIIPSSVTYISDSAFSGCSNIFIYAKAATKPVGYSSGWNNTRPVLYNFDDFYSTAELVYALLNSDELVLLGRAEGATGSTVDTGISFDGYPVIGIHDFAFVDDSAVTMVIIRINIIYIEYRAFHNCGNLASVYVNSSNNLTTIGISAFHGCGKLAVVDLSYATHLETIGSYAFFGCNSLGELHLRESVDVIGYAIVNSQNTDIFFYSATPGSSFNNLWNLNYSTVVYNFNSSFVENNLLFANLNDGSVVLYGRDTSVPMTILNVPNTANGIVVSEIVYGAFINDDDLTQVNINVGLLEIDDYAFRYCNSLTTVSFPSGSLIERIGLRAFQYCDTLSSVNLEECTSLLVIDENAFSITNLSSIIILSNVTTINGYAFLNSSNLTIYCEVSDALTGWSTYWNSNGYTVVWDYIVT